MEIYVKMNQEEFKDYTNMKNYQENQKELEKERLKIIFVKLKESIINTFHDFESPAARQMRNASFVSNYSFDNKSMCRVAAEDMLKQLSEIEEMYLEDEENGNKNKKENG